MMVFDNDKPVLAIEILQHKPTPPRDIAGPITVYMITRKIVINQENGQKKEYDLTRKDSNLKLLIVIPDQPEKGKKSQQIKDLNEKFKGVLDIQSEYSTLKDFAISEIGDLNPVLKKLLRY